MTNIFKELFKSRWQKHIEKVNEYTDWYMRELPRCSNKIIVASPIYNINKKYYCDVIIESEHLLTWACKHKESTRTFNIYEQAAINMLPKWIENRDLNNHSPVTVTNTISELLTTYISNFRKMNIVTYYCYECDDYTDNIEVIENSSQNGTSHIFNYSEKWICSKGHHLHSFEGGGRFIY